MRTIRVTGYDTLEGFQALAMQAAVRYDNEDDYNTIMQCLRSRKSMLESNGYLILDSQSNGILDTNKLM